METNLGLIGNGFVGGAVNHAFDCVKYVVDPKNMPNNTIIDLARRRPQVVFICLPTPQSASGECDGSIIDDVLNKLVKVKSDAWNPVIAIKSTVTPAHLDSYQKKYGKYLRIVYNPEFLTQVNANEDFINAKFHIFGGDPDATKELQEFYWKYSKVDKEARCFFCDRNTASLVKYTLNCFMATKVTFFNHMFDIIAKTNTENTYNDLIEIISADPRVGLSHLAVPGPDGGFGFGGACFPKDTAGLDYYCKQIGVKNTQLEATIADNKVHRNKGSLELKKVS